jgi:hypothetical protein
MGLSGCVLHGKPKAANSPPPPPAPVPVAVTPAPPPGPLSIRQTQVDLPPAQPLTEEALNSMEPPETPPTPKPTPKKSGSSGRPAVAGPPRQVETPTPAAAEAPAAQPPAGSERARVQELLPPEERQRLQSTADAAKQRVAQWLASPRARRVPDDAKKRIASVLQAIEDAEKRGDMQEAAELADRALNYMREQTGGR